MKLLKNKMVSKHDDVQFLHGLLSVVGYHISFLKCFLIVDWISFRLQNIYINTTACWGGGGGGIFVPHHQTINCHSETLFNISEIRRMVRC